MNTNRLLIGLAVAIVIAFLFSSFVYRQFKQASGVKPVAMQNLVVAAAPLQIGARLDANNLRVIPWPASQPQDRDGKPQTVPVITLLVTPDQATALTMGSTEGKIQLALRNTIDTKKNDPAPVLQAVLFAPPGGIPKPVVAEHNGMKRVLPPPPQAYTVEVITGNKRENKSFPATADH